jgi:hypothetical protein
MPPSDLLAMIRKRPFVPFRMHLSDGTVYEIHRPEMVMPTEPLYTRTQTVAMRHVVRLVPLDSAVSKDGI